MMIARRHLDARFGHKQMAIDLIKTRNREIAVQIDWTSDKVRFLTGSVGDLSRRGPSPRFDHRYVQNKRL